jgi:hypothetical protein
MICTISSPCASKKAIARRKIAARSRIGGVGDPDLAERRAGRFLDDIVHAAARLGPGTGKDPSVPT